MGKMGSPSRQKRIRLLTYWRNGVATYGKKGCCFLVFCFIDLFFSILGGIKSQDVTKTGVRHMGGKGGRFAGTISSEMPPDREESAAGGGGGVSGRGEVGTDCETADLWWATTPSASSTSPESNCAATESANERGSATPPSLTPPPAPPPPPPPPLGFATPSGGGIPPCHTALPLAPICPSGGCLGCMVCSSGALISSCRALISRDWISSFRDVSFERPRVRFGPAHGFKFWTCGKSGGATFRERQNK